MPPEFAEHQAPLDDRLGERTQVARLLAAYLAEPHLLFGQPEDRLGSEARQVGPQLGEMRLRRIDADLLLDDYMAEGYETRPSFPIRRIAVALGDSGEELVPALERGDVAGVDYGLRHRSSILAKTRFSR